VPAGKGRTALVDTRDVAARVHTARSHEGRACILTDPAALTDDVRRRTGRMPGTLGSFTRDHASPGRQPPWPLPERLASSTRPIGKEAACGSAVPGVACPRTGPEVAFKQGHSTLPPTRASPDNEPGIG
jgi:hypothetical protein